MNYVLEFVDPLAVDPGQAGGKGASLARLSQGGFPVPPGLVVAADAYRAFLADDDRHAAEVAGLRYDRPEQLVEGCRAIRERLIGRPLPEPVADSLREKLPTLLTLGPVAVRSSSTLEDLAGAAFAGQHDTYLNIADVEAALEATRRCFASLWEDRAVRYRHERGFAHERAAMAVVIQSMVASDVAGVAFTMNPITGARGQVVINAAFGLGELVVSGEGDVDQFVVDKTTGAAVDRHIAEKSHAIVGTADGTERVELPPERAGQPSLTDEDITELAELCRRVERFYAFPQDIEWAIAERRLYLLQSRPVTKFPPRWTRDESAERFPSPITPLTWDFTSDGFHESLAHSLGLMGFPPCETKWFERFDGFIYGNQTMVELYTGGEGVAFDSLEELAAAVPTFRDRFRWVQELPVTWARDLDRYLFRLGQLSAVDTAALSESELWDHVLTIDALGREYFEPNIAISITQGVLHRTLYRLLVLLLGPEEAPVLYDSLTGFCETKTNVVNRDLYRVYLIALEDPELCRTLSGVDREELWRSGVLDRHPAFLERFRQFIEDHGHREVEFDAYHPTWRGQPWVVLENLRLMLEREDGVTDPAERERELRVRQHQAEGRLFAIVPESLRFFVAELLRLTRAYTALDDLEHYQTTRLSVPFRAALVELGSRLQGRGVLDEPEDIFFLRKPTLDSLIAGDGIDEETAREARAHKAEFARQLRSTPPHVIGEEMEAPAEGALRGLPGAPGTVEGPVFRVFGVEDFPRFPSGAVLVARTTNPAWTPLFYSAAAAITESGGPLSHGAVTAREVGLPAVMGVRNALSALQDGERVRVNGTAGSVTRLE
ncbi:MAG: phosphoenolpyruvate synthase [Gemmatimonadetes bacterium]|uniref:Phosphoenolpyruvate synthase n=1 Tax=Candidatus Kutchimonas denitrificans TaxID=3056748 RepID=A0AAE4ZAH7_9BACT|nr:phosphoenolpyruvate synthase [Gemmatimonadota bacterium]NIR75657.1 phosphoenolpyruvate synthase [Candidatus Kutchimonas denitrificans]NIR99636.1 phosphoenolpyruvate synthase [Gemmatimonadota bacterium]NIT65911.1 phosphoenolpyruvate synthase [Gemmatimonadota bacterium]NIV22080.1 phosphoenolpyruvate synthase [Gemmatimonadota bacterium]